jgi:hypothetical protein
MEPDGARRVRALLGRGLDWDYVYTLAGRHKLIPLLYWHLRAVCPWAVPEDALSRLRDTHRKSAAYSLLLNAELCRLLNLFAANGIRVIPFKGPALAAAVYGNVALRQFSRDIDLTVHSRDVPRATELLLADGYTCAHGPGRAREVAAEPNCELLFTKSGAGLPLHFQVDLHWTFLPSYVSPTFAFERFWERAAPFEQNGATVMTLPPEELLLILCAHGGKEMWQWLVRVCDVAELVKARRDMDWDRAVREAAASRTRRMLLLGLSLARDLLGAALPAEVSRMIERDAAVAWLAARVRGRLFEPAHLPPRLSEICAYHLKLREKYRDSLYQLLCSWIKPAQADWAAVRLPGRLSFVYYLVRPLRLAKKYGLKRL